MSDANSLFLAWLRRGITTRMAPPSGSATRSTVRVRMQVAQEGVRAQTVNTSLQIAGPEDVRGIEARAVRRTWPRAEVLNAEPNLLALVEFTACDLPWRFSPEAPLAPAGRVTTSQLRPWVCLVVLAEDEFTLTPASDRQPFTRLAVKPAAVLPPLEEAWAWSHVQYFGDRTLTRANVSEELRDHPERFVSRLLCPRRLKAGTVYHGFVVPVYQRGALAGLGESIPPGVGATAFAWGERREGEFSLPVYYQWRFGTGQEGDFEAIVRRLRPRPLPETVGTRSMTVSVPELGDVGSLASPVLLEAALQPVRGTGSAWGAPPQRAFSEALRALLDLPADERERPGPPGRLRRPVVPPMYGQRHALRERLGPIPVDSFAVMGWLAALNADPRQRVGAGMGTRVVQKLQQALMASAWEQFGRVQEANEALRFGQLGREASKRLYARWLAPLAASPGALLGFTAAVHGQVLRGRETVRGELRRSPVDPGLLDPAWRRLTRRDSALGTRQGRFDERRPVSIVARMNSGALRPAQAVHTPSGAASPAKVARVVGASFPLTFLGMLAVLPTEDPGRLGGHPAWGELRRAAQNRELDHKPELLPAVLGVPPKPKKFRFFPPVPPEFGKQSGEIVEGTDEAAGAFREAFRELLSALGAPEAPGESLVPADLGGIVTTLLEALNPERTVAEGVLARLDLSPLLRRPSPDPLAPVMATPEFEQPMYAPLRDLSQEWILPGLDAVLTDTATTAMTNRRFVEAYMVGLNHEMMRELLWNGYPTDQRGSPFRQFWEPGGEGDASGSAVRPEMQKDILPLHEWRGGTALGAHPVGIVRGENVVLLLRSELLRRYPETIIYAVDGRVRTPDGRAPGPEADAPRKRPTFTGALRPDVNFLGFDLTPDEMRGVHLDRGGVQRRWYFVFEEQVAEFRFGLDEGDPGSPPPLRGLDDLAWTHVGVERGAILRVRGAVGTRTLETVLGEVGVAALGAERIASALFQKRVKVAIPADCMLPPGGG